MVLLLVNHCQRKTPGPQSWGRPHFHGLYVQELDHVLTVRILTFLFRIWGGGGTKSPITDWEKVCAKHESYEGPGPQIYKELKIQQWGNKQPTWKMGEELDRHLIKDIQATKKHTQRYSKSPVLREMQIKTTMWHHNTIHTQMANSKQTNQNQN